MKKTFSKLEHFYSKKPIKVGPGGRGYDSPTTTPPESLSSASPGHYVYVILDCWTCFFLLYVLYHGKQTRIADLISFSYLYKQTKKTELSAEYLLVLVISTKLKYQYVRHTFLCRLKAFIKNNIFYFTIKLYWLKRLPA